MTNDLETIVATYNDRLKAQHPWISKAREVRDLYNGDIVVPLPELEQAEKTAVANNIQLGIDQMGKRIASTVPNVYCPPVRANIKKSDDVSRTASSVLGGWWEANRLRIVLRRRARHFCGYATAPVSIMPDMERKIPRWVLRDPLNTFPAPGMDPDEITPTDCIFAYTRSYAWLHANYPDTMHELQKGAGCVSSTMFDLLEYNDAETNVLIVLGKDKDPNDYTVSTGTAPSAELLRYPNATGMCLAVTPGRVTLDHPLGMFDGAVGLYQQQAMLMALQVMAATKGVFPDQWAVSNDQNVAPEIITVADGTAGIIGQIKGGSIVNVQTNPAFTSLQVMDRLESNLKQEGGIPAEFGGQSATNIRTGRRGDAVMSATIDPTIQEAQEIFEYSLQEENRRAIAVAKAYWGSTSKSIYVGRGKAARAKEYTPNEAFPTDNNLVSYAYAGADAAGLIIEIGQRIGMGTLSKKTGMQVDPMIDDWEQEHDQVIAEGLEAAMMQSVQQQAAAGAIPPADLARIMQLVASDEMDLAAAITKVQAEAQERQATPVPEGAPAAQPGLALPGAGAEAPIDEAQPGTQNLASLLTSLRRPQMALQSGGGRGG